ncbi:MAG: hypothetical protein AAGH40_11705 [Verrucomicrobiota bacterium]
MNRNKLSIGLLAGFLGVLSAPAAIQVTGNFFPNANRDPNFWVNGGNSSQNGAVGGGAEGSLLVDGGSVLNLRDAIFGANGNTGRATISDADSQLIVNRDLIVGRQNGGSGGSTGIINVLNGASLTVAEDATLGLESLSSGSVTVDGFGSVFNVNGGIIVGDDGSGSLTVRNQGQVSTGTIFLARESGSSATFLIEGSNGISDSRVELSGSFFARENSEGLITAGGQLLADVNIELFDQFVIEGNGSLLSTGQEWLLGSSGAGSPAAQITVRDGAQVQTSDTKVAPLDGSVAVLNLTGSGTNLSITNRFDIGHAAGEGGAFGGTATVNVFDGAQVTARVLQLGGDGTDSDRLNLRGSGSRVAVSESAEILESGVLTIHQGSDLQIGGDLVLRTGAEVNLFVGQSTLIQTGLNNTLNPLRGDYDNGGTTNLFASAGLASGDYTPIQVNGSGAEIQNVGTFNAIGGSFDVNSGVFSVSDITTDDSGALGGKRVAYNNNRLVVSFADSVGDIDFEVTRIFPTDIDDRFLVAAYSFDTALEDTPTGLSIVLAETATLDDLYFWYRADEDSPWEAFDESLTAVDGNYATLLVSQFSDYALTSEFFIPEPSLYSLIVGCIALSATALRRRRRR